MGSIKRMLTAGLAGFSVLIGSAQPGEAQEKNNKPTTESATPKPVGEVAQWYIDRIQINRQHRVLGNALEHMKFALRDYRAAKMSEEDWSAVKAAYGEFYIEETRRFIKINSQDMVKQFVTKAATEHREGLVATGDLARLISLHGELYISNLRRLRKMNMSRQAISELIIAKAEEDHENGLVSDADWSTIKDLFEENAKSS